MNNFAFGHFSNKFLKAPILQRHMVCAKTKVGWKKHAATTVVRVCCVMCRQCEGEVSVCHAKKVDEKLIFKDKTAGQDHQYLLPLPSSTRAVR